jgi:acyl CoA:acetate/3-ketoacid CoA transferase alpha subunit/acyl CoA:acetate/3-ketoacid CoA transferase beta subunit
MKPPISPGKSLGWMEAGKSEIGGVTLEMDLQKMCDTFFQVDEEEGISKVMPLGEAVQKLVRPEMSLHFSFTHYRAHGAAYEIARQFWGQQPGFTLIATGILEYGILLVYGGLIKKAIAAFYGDSYPTSSPNPILQDAFSSGKVELESWTNLTIPLRLMAAAYNLPCVPTNSIRGSSMEFENRHAYRLIDDNLFSSGKVGLLSPLQPDLTIIHGFCADPYGNTILLPPYGENVWGAYASKTGVMVTVEKIVPTSYIRTYSHLVKVPGHLVKSVSIVPFGAHPQGMSNQGISDLGAYGEDQRFRMDFRKASRDPKQFEEWVDAWVLGCKGHEGYLKKLGYERLMMLRGRADRNSWIYDIEAKSERISQEEGYSQSEAMVVVTSRIIEEKVLEKGYKNVLAGIGISSLASSLAYYWLKRKKGHHVDLLVETGFYGYAPRPGDPFVFNFANIATNKIQSNFVEILNLFSAGNNNQCLGVLATGQVDKNGNLNSTRLEDGRYLVGAGGSNDVISGAADVIIVLRQSKKRFLEKLPYVTSRGNRISTLISDLGVFERAKNDDDFFLTGCLPQKGFSSLREKVQNVRDHCGWELKVASSVKDIDPPEREELQVIRLLDPEGYSLS